MVRIQQEGDVATGGERGSDGGKQAFEKHRPAHEEAEAFPQRAPSVGHRSAGEGHGDRQLGETEHPGQVQSANDQRGDEHADRSGDGQAEVPAEVHPRDHHAHAQRPDVDHAQGLLENVLPDVVDLLGQNQRGIDVRFADDLLNDGV